MSTQINQYLMWGVSVPYEWAQNWTATHPEIDFYDAFGDYTSDSAFSDKIAHKDGIFCLYPCMNKSPLIIGRVLAKSSDHEYIAEDGPMRMPVLTDLEQELIRESVRRVFGIEGEFTHWLITHYR